MCVARVAMSTVVATGLFPSFFIFVRWGKGMGSHGGVRVASRTHGEYPRPLDPIRWPGSTAHQARYGGGVIVRHSSARMPRCGSTSRSTPEATRTPVPGRQQRPDHASSHHRHGGPGPGPTQSSLVRQLGAGQSISRERVDETK